MNVFTVMGRIHLRMLCSNMMEYPLYYLMLPFVAPWYRMQLKWICVKQRLFRRPSAWEKIRESIHTDEEEEHYDEPEER